MVSRYSRSFERLAEVQARADEEELRARREASKASEAAAAAKRLEAELQQLRGIGSQAQPHHSRRLPPCPPPSLTPTPLSPWRLLWPCWLALLALLAGLAQRGRGYSR